MLKEAIKHLDETHSKKSYRDQDVILLLKLIVLDGETDLKKITDKTLLNQSQVERYLRKKEVISNYLTEEEYDEYLEYYNNLTNFINDQRNLKNTKNLQAQEDADQNKKLFIHKIVTDIMESRLSLDQIAEKNYTISTSVNKIIDNISLIDSMYGEGYSNVLKEKLISNGYIRQSVPRNMFLIDERNDLSIINPSFIYLNEFDFRRLKIISHFIFNNYDIDLTAKENQLTPASIINTLLNVKNQVFLKQEVFEYIQKVGNIEKLLLEGDLTTKRALVDNILNTLKRNEYNINLTSNELGMPENVLKRCLKLDILNVFYKEEVEKLKQIIVDENGNQKR